MNWEEPLNLSKDIPFKADMERYRQWLIGELTRSEVNVLKNRTVDAEMIEKLDPDVTICAIGAEPVVPKIEGDRRRTCFSGDGASPAHGRGWRQRGHHRCRPDREQNPRFIWPCRAAM